MWFWPLRSQIDCIVFSHLCQNGGQAGIVLGKFWYLEFAELSKHLERGKIWETCVRLKIQYPERCMSKIVDVSKTHAFKQLVLAVTETYHLEDQFTSIWVKNSKSNKVFAQSCQKP